MAVAGVGATGALGTYSSFSLSSASASAQLDPLTTSIAPSMDAAPEAGLPALPAGAEIKVTLNSTAAEDVGYSNLAQANSISLAWAAPPTDKLSQLLENNLSAHSKAGDLSALLQGLGSELLNGFAKNQRALQQTVVSYRPNYKNPQAQGAKDVEGTTSAAALQQAKTLQNAINLKIYTASGTEVDIAITFGGDGAAIRDSLSVDVHASNELSPAEQAAIAKLSKGFDAALQGIGSDSTKIDVAGLVDFDTTVLAAVDLNVREAPQTSALQSLDFHADATRRSLTMQSKAGNFSVKVNLSAPAPWGSADQQQAAIQRYLDQFDAANERAHGSATLLGQLKDAFSQLHSSYPAISEQAALTRITSKLSDEDRSALTGLADFQAGMSGDFNNGSQHHYTTEAGHLDYQVAQTTKTQGVAKSSGLSIAQTQTATLASTFLKSRGGLMLDTKTGNYDIYRIKDDMSTTTSFAYADDKLKNAAVVTQTNRSEQYKKKVNHKVVTQRFTPHNTITMQDIAEQLRPKL